VACGIAIIAGVVFVVYGLAQGSKREGPSRVSRKASEATGSDDPLEEPVSPFGLDGRESSENQEGPGKRESLEESERPKNVDPVAPEWFDPAFIENQVLALQHSPDQTASYFKALEERFTGVHEVGFIAKLKDYSRYMASVAVSDAEVQRFKQELEDARRQWATVSEDDLRQLLKWDGRK
jgi:hypothetical protein